MAASWKKSLNLPKSSFPNRPDPKLHSQFLSRCSESFYEWQSDNRPRENPYILHDGPPYANGPLHLGHAMNKVLKDIILRAQVQRGRRVVYRPSWDCHGLPIEMKALKTKSFRSISPGEIRDIAKRLASKTVQKQMKSFQSFGIAADWDKRWTTMDPAYEIRQLRVFQRMVRGGLIYRRRKPVYWSISSLTALAEAELDYRDDHESTAAYVRFPVLSDLSEVPGLSALDGPLYAAIWTTTPWTLPANQAIGVHKDMSYTVLRVDKYNLLVAQSRVDAITEILRTADSVEVVVDSIPGTELVGLKYRNKLHGKESPLQPIIDADFVTGDSGTGLVHLAPGHGQLDFEACSALGIEALAPINDEGIFTAEAYPDDPEKLTLAPSILDGGHQSVLDLIGDDVLAVHALKHKYPYDWRTKKPVIIRATAQWFADVESIKRAALGSLDEVEFFPASSKGRLRSFVKARSEWCISRQRSWGVPIPALYDENGEAVMTDASIEHIIAIMQQRGSDAWFTDSPDEPAWIPPSLQGKFRRGTDTMDVWFDSGSSWAENGRPADVYLEGTDQHRGWFQSSLLTYVASQTSESVPEGEIAAPFKKLITHGFVLDANGRKMSKSIGNTVTPEEIMDGTLVGPTPTKKTKGKGLTLSLDPLGPDALRLWVASSDYKTDIQIGAVVMGHIHSTLIKYRNTIKMLAGSLHPTKPGSPITKLDQIALVQLEDTMNEVGKAFDAHEYSRAIKAINQWLATDLSAFYLEAVKDRLYCGDGGGVLLPIFMGFLRMLAPITPVLVEEAWESRPDWLKEHAHLISPARQLYHDPLVPEGNLPMEANQIRQDLPTLNAVHDAVKAQLEQARKRKVIGSSLESTVILQIENGHNTLEVLRRYSDELDAMFVVSGVGINTELPTNMDWHVTELAQGNDEWYRVHVVPATQDKCGRCWRYVAPKKNSICQRCDEQLMRRGPLDGSVKRALDAVKVAERTGIVFR
ncbi:hypothetical protein S40293_03886 [Stachybotrys chartarum IBT 40293]|nr:hypothetical protein S40293_03886 [Stachybotrys chartarum IBT 40293]